MVIGLGQVQVHTQNQRALADTQYGLACPLAERAMSQQLPRVLRPFKYPHAI